MTKFKVGDIVEWIQDGSIYILVSYHSPYWAVSTIIETAPDFRDRIVGPLAEAWMKKIGHIAPARFKRG